MRFTQQDFRVFRNEANRCLAKLGLTDWHVVFAFEDMENTVGTCEAYFAGRGATLSLRRNELKDWPDKLDVRVIARHEVLELLLRRFQEMALTAVAADLVFEEKHSIIRRLENLL